MSSGQLRAPLLMVAAAALGPALATGRASAAPGWKAEFLTAHHEVSSAPASAAASAAERLAARARFDHALDQRIGQAPAAVVNIYNTWTHEYLVVNAGKDAEPPPEALVDHFLRCHFTNHETHMDPQLIGVLMAAATHFRVNRVNIVSGFRAPKYNLLLRKKGHWVARNSQHTHGHAVNFRLPGVPTLALRNWARRLRLGGVGYYPDDGFVHVNTAGIRTWTN